ncbi:hypothetical protein Pelo_2920 [Pelomyxa schiedti]|nr:hypothetical protein Pelo_2920 [Pelomyxa schiedti]
MQGNHHILDAVCEAGSLDALQWAVDRFGIKQPWELYQPLEAALANGHLEIAQWLVSTFGLDEALNSYAGKCCFCGLHACAMGNDPGIINWATLHFHSAYSSLLEQEIVDTLVHNEKCSPELAQDVVVSLMWGSVMPSSLEKLSNVAMRHWIFESAKITPTEQILNSYCVVATREIQSLKHVEWHIQGGAVPTVETVNQACGNHHDNVELVCLLCEKVALPCDALKNCLCRALANGNISVANFLEGTRHIMASINSNPCNVVELCKKCVESISSLKWVLCHLERKLEGASLLVIVEEIASKLAPETLMFVLYEFPLLPGLQQLEHSELLKSTFVTMLSWHLPDVKVFVSKFTLSADFVASCLSTATTISSSKVVKWIISYFNLTSAHIRCNGIRLMKTMLENNKRGCCSWLIDRFNISLKEFLECYNQWTWYEDLSYISLSTCRMILNKFPEIEAEVTKKYLLPIVTASAHNAAYTVKRLGLPADFIVNECKPLVGPGAFAAELDLWYRSLG